MTKPPDYAATFFETWQSTLVGHLGLQSISCWDETPCTLWTVNVILSGSLHLLVSAQIVIDSIYIDTVYHVAAVSASTGSNKLLYGIAVCLFNWAFVQLEITTLCWLSLWLHTVKIWLLPNERPWTLWLISIQA